jgi:transketolase
MAESEGPAYMRTGRVGFPVLYDAGTQFEIGKAKTLRQGQDVTLVGSGLMVAAALEAAHLLQQEGIGARVLDVHTIRPLDEEAIVAAASETGCIVTAEEHLLTGGLGSEVARVVARTWPVPMEFVGLGTYATSADGDELLQRYGLTADDIAAAARRAIARK